MHKIIAGILLSLSAFPAVAQGPSATPMGIPVLSIKSLLEQPRLSPPSLEIETNQEITDAANCTCQTGCTVLPVSLLSFEGRRVNTELVELNWKTANEYQNKGFEVQRSLGNTNTFIALAFVPAQTSGALQYEYELPDPNNYSGTSYYRLKQVDLDGFFIYSETVAIKGTAHQSSLALYPNPVAELLVANIFSAERSAATLLITDAAQKTLFTQSIALNKGINLVNLPAAAALSKGVYFVQVRSKAGDLLSGKFIRL